MKKILTLVLISLLFVSCTTYVSYEGSKSIVDANKYKKAIEGVTTEKDIRKMFGDNPRIVRDSSTELLLVYQYDVFAHGALHAPFDLGMRVLNFTFNKNGKLKSKLVQERGEIDIPHIIKKYNYKFKEWDK